MYLNFMLLKHNIELRGLPIIDLHSNTGLKDVIFCIYDGKNKLNQAHNVVRKNRFCKKSILFSCIFVILINRLSKIQYKNSQFMAFSTLW